MPEIVPFFAEKFFSQDSGVLNVEQSRVKFFSNFGKKLYTKIGGDGWGEAEKEKVMEKWSDIREYDA